MKMTREMLAAVDRAKDPAKYLSSSLKEAYTHRMRGITDEAVNEIEYQHTRLNEYLAEFYQAVYEQGKREREES